MHAFGIWLDYILGHVVGEFMRRSCCTLLMSHRWYILMYMFGTLIDGICLDDKYLDKSTPLVLLE